jgi:hypothetical protein
MTSPGIETTSFRLLAWYLNQLRYRVPPLSQRGDFKIIILIIIYRLEVRFYLTYKHASKRLNQ